MVLGLGRVGFQELKAFVVDAPLAREVIDEAPLNELQSTVDKRDNSFFVKNTVMQSIASFSVSFGAVWGLFFGYGSLISILSFTAFGVSHAKNMKQTKKIMQEHKMVDQRLSSTSSQLIGCTGVQKMKKSSSYLEKIHMHQKGSLAIGALSVVVCFLFGKWSFLSLGAISAFAFYQKNEVSKAQEARKGFNSMVKA